MNYFYNDRTSRTCGNQSPKMFCLTQNLFGNSTKDSKVSAGLAVLPEKCKTQALRTTTLSAHNILFSHTTKVKRIE